MPLIGLDAPFQGTGSEGGSEHIVLGLVSGLGKLTDGNEEYAILVPPDATDWLKPYLGPNQKVVRWQSAPLSRKELLKKWMGPVRRPLGKWFRAVGLLERQDPYAVAPTPTSDGFCERLGIDLLHLLYPLHFFKSQIPSLLTVHDLQHRHFPEYFFWNDIPWRERLYPDALAHVQRISAISWFVGRDIVHQYQTPESKIHVVPWASPTDCYSVLPTQSASSVTSKYRLPPQFILYPSVTYGHKNHIRLLEALAKIRDEKGLKIPLVCTGWKKLYWPKIEQRISELRLHDQVHFVGYVSEQEIKSLYAQCQFVVFPSLFEGCGLALLEAFRERKAVAASDIPPFHEYGLDAPIFFNPTSVSDIAEKLLLLWRNETLRQKSVARSEDLIRLFQWEKVAKTYRAIYRSMLGTPLTAEDHQLLNHSALSRAIERSSAVEGPRLPSLA